MSLNKVLTLTFVFLMIIIGLEGFYYIIQNKTKTSILPTVTSTTNIKFSPSAKFKILYQAPDDKEGRTIIYQAIDPAFKYSGAGEFYDTATSPAQLTTIVGRFRGWEAINKTKDRYLLLDDPIKKKDLIKVRVAFQPSELFDGKSNMTALAIENLQTGKIEYPKKTIKDLTSDKVDFIFQAGDTVIIFPFNKGGKLPIRDENNNILAIWIIVRRSNENAILF